MPLWLAVGPTPWGVETRHAVLALALRPLHSFQRLTAGLSGFLQGPRLRVEQERLRRELLAVRQEPVRVEELTREVARLRTLLSLKQQQSRPAVAARLIGRDATPWFRTLLLDAGRHRGVVEGAAVVAPPPVGDPSDRRSENAPPWAGPTGGGVVAEGLVGQVLEVGPETARALLVTDPRFRVGALVQRSRAQGIAVGTVRGRCYVTYLTRADAIQVGDVVLTSGVGGLVPKGLVIGQVVRVEQDPSGLYWQAELTPAVDPSFVEEVLCLR